MSASREKHTRQSATPVAAEKKKLSISTILAIAFIVVSCIIIFLIVLFKGPYFEKHTTAVKAGSHNITPVEARYYYVDTYNNLLNNGYSTLLSYMYTSDIEHFEDEYISDDTTWGSYIWSMALNSIKDVYALYDQAIAADYTLSEDGESDIDTTELYLNYYTSMSGLSSVDSYLVNMYGKGSTLDSYLNYIRIQAIASEYATSMEAGFEVSSDEIQAKFDEDPTVYTYYTYHSYQISATYDDDATDEEKAAALTAAEDAANGLVNASESLDDYLNAVGTYAGDVEGYADGTNTVHTDVTSDSIYTEVIKDWVTDPARTENEAGVIVNEDSNCVYVVYFVSADDSEGLSLAEEDIRSDMLTEWEDEVINAYTAEEIAGGMKYMDDTLTFTVSD